MWSVLVLFLGPEHGFTPADKFLLTAVPTLVGAALQLPYAFAVASFGGRTWTTITALALLVPLALMLVVHEPGVFLGTLTAVAAVAGGNFASSMANINVFYPQHLKGWALGLDAGAGLGVPAVQLVGLAVLATVGAAHLRFLVALYVPLVLVAAYLAWTRMDDLTSARNDKRAMRDGPPTPHTWVLSFRHLGTFGSFIGFGFAFGQVLQVQFADDPPPLDAAYLTFLGPLLGSLVRPYGGRLAAGVRRRVHGAVRAQRPR
jgi:NNP family nitrate/nitrite transporter-like MFS transporter